VGRAKSRKGKSGAGSDEEMDSLFGLPPEDFVAARDDLAGRLRQEGNAEAASEVKGLRRPTVAAWAVNQLSRRHSKEVRELLDVGTELRRAHSRAVSKRGAGGLRESTSRRRAIVARLAEAADEILAEAGRGAGAHREAVVQSLEAATIDQEVADLVARGRLSKEVTAVAGFGGMEGLAEPEVTSKERLGAPRRPGRAASDREAARRQELEAARREAEELADSAAAGEQEAEAAKREAHEARGEADRLEQDWRAARDRAASAAASAKTASTAADRARAAADRARRRVERLETEISAADRP
jgi:hypothetical protein